MRVEVERSIHLGFPLLPKKTLNSVAMTFIDLGWLWDSTSTLLGSLLMSWKRPYDVPAAPKRLLETYGATA